MKRRGPHAKTGFGEPTRYFTTVRVFSGEVEVVK
jgi:hypothetical protein